MASPILQQGSIGPVRLPNRVIRAATSESMATPAGEVTDEMVALHARSPEAASASPSRVICSLSRAAATETPRTASTPTR